MKLSALSVLSSVYSSLVLAIAVAERHIDGARGFARFRALRKRCRPNNGDVMRKPKNARKSWKKRTLAALKLFKTCLTSMEFVIKPYISRKFTG